MSSVERTGDEGVTLLYDLSKEELVKIIVDDAKNWLAHDGVWFQAVEKRYGMDVAVRKPGAILRRLKQGGSWIVSG